MPNSLVTIFKQKIARFTYSLLWLLLIPFLIIYTIFSLLIRKKGYSLTRLSRYGICKTNNKKTILVHCASVGEVVAIQMLVEEIQRKHPHTSIAITTNTTTGSERVKLLFKDKVAHYYLPYDFPAFTWLFLRKLNPSKVLINEMELWPNLTAACKKRDIPLYIVNGRMSEKSTKTYQKFPALFEPMLANFTHICAQGERDYNNYLSLGANQNKLTLTNNIKFELKFDVIELSKAQEITTHFLIRNRIVLVAGSTHEPEEQVLLDAYSKLHQKHPDLLLILVPRHPHRFEKVHQQLLKQSIEVNLMSKNKPITSNTQVLLCDQMGMLRALYTLADIAFVGGSIANRGGHNALEPAAFNIPIMMGPSNYNNPAIHNALKQAGALKSVENAQQITSVCNNWLADTSQKLTDGQAGGKVLKRNSGAIERTLKVLNL
jgi:3-deoxy-D-manno-octulosonic-acid transferase